jgi:outer membrane protein assembly factor BamB
MKWIITLPVLPLSNDDLNRPLRNRTSAPVVWRGRLIAAPRGADAVFGCDAGTGEILWRRELPERGLQVAGVAGSTLIASGKSLWGIEAATGRVLWRVGFEDEDGSGAGQAAIVGDTVYWCTFTDLIAVDAQSGELRQRDPLRERDSLRGGSVYAAGNRLLVVTADEIAAIELEPSTSPAVGPHAGIGP